MAAKYRQTTSDMTHTGFLIRTSGDVRRKGWGYAHIWEMGVSMALYGSLLPSLGFWGD